MPSNKYHERLYSKTMKSTILCVDDEIDNVEVLERTFRTSYDVMTATSGFGSS